ncbi:hypothetical protein L584_17780 [Pantoea agglomerans Tx10]|nr:hypothetical protein L584_17780 [Pantoea agglomerans Tx10]
MEAVFFLAMKKAMLNAIYYSPFFSSYSQHGYGI